jgi:hypothetical protein
VAQALDAVLNARGELAALAADGTVAPAREPASRSDGARTPFESNWPGVDDEAVDDEAVDDESERQDTALTRLPTLRRVLDAHDIPEDGPTRSVVELQKAAACVVRMRRPTTHRLTAINTGHNHSQRASRIDFEQLCHDCADYRQRLSVSTPNHRR